MHASLNMMARIVTMLACLILVPLAALFGTALPDIVREKLAGPAPRAAARPGPAASLALPNSHRPATSAASPPAPSLSSGSAPAADATQSDQLLVLLERLQKLGALHYRLERSPQAGGQYWFHCDVSGSREPFVATDSDPIRTTERVVRLVEAWHASKLR